MALNVLIMSKFILFYILFSLVSISLAQVLQEGQCDTNVAAITDFDAQRFMGTWHEISRIPSDLQTGECVSNQYASAGTNTFTITQTTVLNERQNTVNIPATVATDGRGVITVNIEGVPFNIYILGVDYNDYALLYGCRNINNNPSQRQIFSWKLSKSRAGLSPAANTAITQMINNNNHLQETQYSVTQQDNNACFYYPVFDQLPTDVIMPGPCPDIRGVADFKADEYLGRWYEAARYPTSDHKGTCNRADYTESDTSSPHTVMSFNEVIEETLVTQKVNAVHNEDLTGHFVAETVNDDEDEETHRFDYYVLATDYTSYALVYTCENLDNGNSKVKAWKRSRTTTLSAEASTAIDNAIAEIRGISNEYFQPTSQSADDCFYIPTLTPQIPPRFRGQCPDITGVENFDMERFLGWWHEIESYPNIGVVGECTSSRYSPRSDSDYRVDFTTVRNNNGITTTGTVTATADGRLRRAVVGSVFQDIWVLATDYETYALVYSCINVNSEYMTVWSSIQSKTRDPISEAAKAAIAPIIANNKVLIEKFYLPMDQSAETCFYYPLYPQGDIILPGQCDLTIPVVQDFEADSFSGDWFHIESYDLPEDRSCLGTRFTVDEDSEDIAVMDYAVIEDELELKNGTAKLVATDNSAKFELSFPNDDSEDSTRNVYVLTTNYTHYALAYSCENVDAYRRHIRAWKLSRSRVLFNPGNAAINDVVRERQELHQPYFRRMTQNVDCPTPSSAFIATSSIILVLAISLLQRLF